MADDLTLFPNTAAQANSLLHSQEQTAEGIGLYVNANKTEYMCFKQKGAISILCGKVKVWISYQSY